MGNIVNEGEDKLDLDTGYFTRKSFLIGSDACEKFEETTTEFIRDMKIEKNGRAWYLTTITLPGGILYPDKKVEKVKNDAALNIKIDKIKWVVAPVVPIDDGNNYPIPGEDGKVYQTRVDIEGAKQFSEFKEGLVYLGML
tara:strand:- start:82 stop:501 length:420 start_codon:yes stop_codon:yes gene_type:complete